MSPPAQVEPGALAPPVPPAPVSAPWGTFDPPIYGPVPLRQNKVSRTPEMVVWSFAAVRHVLVFVLSLAFLPWYQPDAALPQFLLLMPIVGLAGAILALVSSGEGRTYELGRAGAGLSFVGSIVPGVWGVGIGGMALSALGFYLHTRNKAVYRGMRSFRDYL